MSINWLKGAKPPCDGEYCALIEAKESAPYVKKGDIRLEVGWFTAEKGWYLPYYSNGNATEYIGVWEVVGWHRPTPVKFVYGKI